MHAVANILSFDGLSGISVPLEPVDSLTSMVNAAGINKSAPGKRRMMVQNSNEYLQSLMGHGAHWKSPARHPNGGVLKLKGTTNLGVFSSDMVWSPRNSAVPNMYEKPASRGPISDGNGLGMFHKHGPRGDSLKRQRENESR